MKPPRQPHLNRERRHRGALMAAALMMTVAAGLVLSGWGMVMAARAVHVTTQEDALKRRQSLLNTQAISRQLLLQHHYKAGAAHTGTWQGALAAPDGSLWGGIALPGGWSGNVFATNNDAATSGTIFPFNASGLARGDSFLVIRETTSAAAVWTAQDYVRDFGFIKMNCPPLRGDLFTVYKKPPGKGAGDVLDIYTLNAGHFGGWVVEGRMVIKDIPSLFAASTQSPLQIPARVRSLYIPEENDNRTIVATSPTGARIPPSNLAGVPMTVGSIQGASMWEDRLNVVRNDANPENSLWHFMEREQAAGNGSFVTVDSANFTMPGADPPLWVQKQINPPGPLDPPAAPDEFVGLTYPPANWPNGYARRWNVLFIRMDHPNLPNIRVTAGTGVNRIHQVVFRGQAPLSPEFDNARLLPPRIVLITKQDGQDLSPVQDIRFEHVNNRRWVLGIKSGNITENLEIGFEGSPVLEGGGGGGIPRNVHLWRCILVNESRELFLSVRNNQNARFVGGVMTDWIFKRRRSVSGFPRNEAVDGLVFRQDTDPEPEGAAGVKFSSLLPRDAWLESYFSLPAAAQAPAPP